VKNHQHTFELLGFYGYEFGTDTENSEDRFQAIVDSIAGRLSGNDIENPVWEFADEDDEITTESLDFRPIGLIDAGGFLHFGGGKIVLNHFPC